VVRPYLVNKKDKTFLDHWLLEDDLGDYLQPWRFGRLNTVERILLAQRIKNEPARTARHLTDLYRLKPPNLEHILLLFDTAIKSGELGTDDAFGLYKAREETRQILKELKDQKGGGGAGPGGAQPRPAPDGGRAGEAKAPAEEAERARDAPAKKEGDGRKLQEQLDKRMDKSKSDAEHRREPDSAFFYAEDRAGRAVRPLYRRLDPTQEWAENNYYHLLIQQQLAELVTVNPFWLDLARHDGKSPFLSKHLAEAGRNFTEMMFALAVLDLPFEPARPQVAIQSGRLTLTPPGPVVAFHEEVKPTEPATEQLPILVSQNFYRQGERYREVNGERLDKFVTGEFLVHTVYGCQVVVTNPTSSRQKLSVLVQVPVGALPVSNGQQTQAVQLDLEPYRTQTIDYLFYFPLPGKFAHFPVNVAKNGRFVAAAQPVTFDVVARLSKIDTASWDYVSQNGTNEEVLAFLNRENVESLNLEKIAFRLKDRAFFSAVLTLLQERHRYQPTVWSYALFHADVPAARQYLLHAEQIVAEAGGPLDSPLLSIDPVARYQYEHLEYRPLVNARAHALGQRRQIVNNRFHEQYHRFLKLLSYRKQLDGTDRLAVVYYLLLQDRVEEALAAFVEVNSAQVATKMQYDYCLAYLDFYRENSKEARAIASRYADHPVDRWRNAFASILSQLDEAEGKAGKVVDAEDRGQRQGQLAATEPGFEFTLDARAINLSWQNLETVRINYYLMDVELLFSRNPFVQQVSGPFASIRPNGTQEVKLPAGKNQLVVPLPESYVRRNVLVEITAAGKTRTLPYYANAMDVRLIETYGQVRVTETASGKPLAKVYVKVYVRLAGGQVKFHKDGYTDLRGRFDYASVSTPERLPPERFAILVLSDERGALIREAAPPQQ
jgi:hypothetical protein